MCTRYTCIYTIYTPLNTSKHLYTPCIRPKTTYYTGTMKLMELEDMGSLVRVAVGAAADAAKTNAADAAAPGGAAARAAKKVRRVCVWARERTRAGGRERAREGGRRESIFI